MDEKFRQMLTELRMAQKILRQDMERPSLWRWILMLGGAAMMLVGLQDLL